MSSTKKVRDRDAEESNRHLTHYLERPDGLLELCDWLGRMNFSPTLNDRLLLEWLAVKELIVTPGQLDTLRLTVAQQGSLDAVPEALDTILRLLRDQLRAVRKQKFLSSRYWQQRRTYVTKGTFTR